MRYSVGYQARPDWAEEIVRRRESVAEVYFAWPGVANGRGGAAVIAGEDEWQEQEQMRAELSSIAQAGIDTNLLLNAMCYGAQSQARSFFMALGGIIDFVGRNWRTKSVTTTSPLIARFVHANFPGMEVRASVNMGVGSVEGMRTVEAYFDGFYLRRELNRHPAQIERMKKWCDENGKRLYFLANSGCVRDCAMHAFHDTLVAHEREIAQFDNAYAFEGVCWERLKAPGLREEYLQNATFVRPEDIGLYEEWFSVAKLATRTNRDPARVLEAYSNGRYRGSLPALMEPNHEGAFAPDILENSALPADFGRRVMECGQRCERCGACKKAFRDALRKGEGIVC